MWSGETNQEKNKTKRKKIGRAVTGLLALLACPACCGFGAVLLEGGRDEIKALLGPATKKKNLRRRSTGGVSSSICESVCRRNFLSDGLP